MRALLLACPLLLANAEDPPAIPAEIRTMLDAAMASGNEADVTTLAKYARAAAPASADAIAKLAADWKQARSKAAEATLRDADFLALVKGRAELGAYASTGNTRNIGVTAALDLKREGLEWRHKLRAQADYQESLGVTTRERYLVAYEPNWKFDERAYLYGAAQFESDRFQGFDQRYSLSVGGGYSAFRRPGLKLDLELGPAYRNTRFVDAEGESNLALRGSLDLDWKVNRSVSVRQNASAYVQSTNSTIASKSALVTRLVGPLSAQLSYALQYESMPPPGRKTTDTTSRAALLVDF